MESLFVVKILFPASYTYIHLTVHVKIEICVFFCLESTHPYESFDESLCLGTNVTAWKNGEFANHGKVYGIENCKSVCDLHFECLGFQYVKNLDLCGFWKTAEKPRLEVKLSSDSNHVCYRKGK